MLCVLLVGVFYGGDDNTLVANKGFEPKLAKKLYTNFMNTFKGIKLYQDYCRKEDMDKGYNLMNPITCHRAHIYDYELLKSIQDRFKEEGFWQYYEEMKKTAPSCDTVRDVRRYFKRKSEIERMSINYRIQNRGSGAFKLSTIKLFNWIIANNYQNVVKICVVAHDEINLECPEEISKEVGDILVKCMIAGGKPFCPNVYLGADLAVGDHWIH